MSAISTLKRNWRNSVGAAALTVAATAGTGCSTMESMGGVTTEDWFNNGAALGAGGLVMEVAEQAGAGANSAGLIGVAAGLMVKGALDHHGSQIPECDHRESTNRDVRVNNKTGQVIRDETQGRTTTDCRRKSYGSNAGAQGYDPNPTGYGQPGPR